MRGISRKLKPLSKAGATLLVTLAMLLQPLVALNIPSAFALGGTVTISSVSDLRNAIENQADGQTWEIQPGEYGLTRFDDITAGGQTGWYFPIIKNDITIIGVGNPTLYGTGFSANGNWSSQDFVAVFGDNVTIDGVTLMPKVEPNKTVEVLGSDFTLRNTVITPNTLTDQTEYDSVSDPSDPSWTQDSKQWGGSLYFNHAGNHTVENVTIINAGISFRYSPSGTNITFNNVELSYATNVDWINGYRYSSGFNNGGNSLTGALHVVYHISDTLGNLDSVLTNLHDGDTVQLDSNLTVSKQLTLIKSVTFDGNGHTLSPNFTKTDNDNNSALGIQADNVTVKNLVENGTNGINLHGINVYDATGVNVNDVTVMNNDRTGLNVDRSVVTVNNITTENNGWHGVDVDKPGAILTVNGVSHHTEIAPDIYVDDTSVGQVIDANNQYGYVDNVLQGGDRVYKLKLGAPTLVYPSNDGYMTTNDFYFDWGDVAGAVSYEAQFSQSNSTDSDGSLNVGVWSGDANHNQPTDSRAWSSGATGTWYWQVRAVDAYGIKGPWSSVWKMTIDMTAPAAPVLVSPENNAIVNGASITQSWSDSSSDVDHYIYESYNNSSATSLRWHEEFTGTSKTATNVGTATYWWRVKAVDAAGNESAWSELRKITVDNTVPTTPSITAPSNEQYFKTTPITNSWTASTDTNGIQKYQVEYIYDDGHTFSGGPYRDVSGSTTSRNHTPALTEQGGVTIRVRAIDNAGNASAWSAPVHYYYDATNPTSSDDLGSLLSGNVTVTQHVSDNIAAKSGKLRIWKLTLGTPDNSKFFAIGDVNVDTSGDVTYNLDTQNNLYGDGEYIAKFTATDKAGNAIVTQKYFTVDNTAPVVTIDPVSASTNQPTLTGTVDDSTASVVVTIDKVDYPAVNNGDGTWSYAFPSPLVDGTYTVILTATDTAGNTSAPVTTDLTIDTNQAESNGSDQTGSQTTSNPTTPAAAVLGITTTTQNADDATGDVATAGQVLAAEDTNTSSTGDTSESASDTTKDNTANSGKVFGLLWYWWLIILAGVALLWWIVAAIRTRNDEN